MNRRQAKKKAKRGLTLERRTQHMLFWAEIGQIQEIVMD